MDAGNLIYIAAVIIYFIYTALKKNKNQDEINEPSHRTGQPEQKRKPVSFEELLKEIRQGQDQREREIHPPLPQKTTETYSHKKDNRPLERKATTSDRSQNKSKKYERYEGVIEPRNAPERTKLADQDRLSSSISGLKSEPTHDESRSVRAEHRIGRLLRDPKTVKDAVILSEVLNRKYI